MRPVSSSPRPDAYTMPAECWLNVCDGGPGLIQRLMQSAHLGPAVSHHGDSTISMVAPIPWSQEAF